MKRTAGEDGAFTAVKRWVRCDRRHRYGTRLEGEEPPWPSRGKADELVLFIGAIVPAAWRCSPQSFSPHPSSATSPLIAAHSMLPSAHASNSRRARQSADAHE